MTDTNLEAVTLWVDAYRRAWESNEPDDIRALFAEDGEYLTEPFAEPWRGHKQIVEEWLKARDEPGDTTFEWHPVAANDDVAVVQGRTVYAHRAQGVYDNLWVIRWAHDGRARSFTEWWMKPAGE